MKFMNIINWTSSRVKRDNLNKIKSITWLVWFSCSKAQLKRWRPKLQRVYLLCHLNWNKIPFRMVLADKLPSLVKKSRYRSDHWCNGWEDKGASREDDSGSENVGVAIVLRVIGGISLWSILIDQLKCDDVFSIEFFILFCHRWVFYIVTLCPLSLVIKIAKMSISRRKMAHLARLEIAIFFFHNAAETLFTFILGNIINVLFEEIVLDLIIVS